MNILKLKETDTDKIRLVKKSLIGLRDYYPEFSNWFDSKILPNINKSRNIYLAYNSNGFGGALITKNGKKVLVCIDGDYGKTAIKQYLTNNENCIILSADELKEGIDNGRFD